MNLHERASVCVHSCTAGIMACFSLLQLLLGTSSLALKREQRVVSSRCKKLGASSLSINSSNSNTTELLLLFLCCGFNKNTCTPSKCFERRIMHGNNKVCRSRKSCVISLREEKINEQANTRKLCCSFAEVCKKCIFSK